MTTRRILATRADGGTGRAVVVGLARAVRVAAVVLVAAIGPAGCSSSSSSPTPARGPSSPEPGIEPNPIRKAGSNSSSSAISELREIELQRLEHLVDADVDRAAQLHADDFELIPPPGYPMSREDYLAAVETGDLDYHLFEPISDIEVRVHGTTAVLWYQSRIDIAAAGLGRFEHDAWHLYGSSQLRV